MSARGLSAAWLVCVTLLPKAALLAQGPDGPRSQDRREGQERREGRDELFKMIDAYMVSNLRESLGLSEDQFVKVLPLVMRLQAERRGYQHRRIAALHGLRRALRSGGATEPQVAELLKELKAIESEEPAAMKRHLGALDAALTPAQQAKYRVLEAEVDQKLRQIFAEARHRNRPGPRRNEPSERR